MNHITKKQNEFIPDLIELTFEGEINNEKVSTKILLPKILADQIDER
jgi:putative transposon-encoded protein